MKNSSMIADEMEKQGIDDYEYPLIEFINKDLGDVIKKFYTIVRLDRRHIHFRFDDLLRPSPHENDVADGSAIAAWECFCDTD